MSPVCTHLGCAVPIASEKERQSKPNLAFKCPCHGGQFDKFGNNIGGPPPRPCWQTRGGVMQPQRNKIWIFIAHALGVTIVFIVFRRVGWLSGWEVDKLYRTVQSFGVWAPFVAIGLMILHSFLPIPGEIIAIINGMAFGSIWGVIYTWLGVMAGAYVSFFYISMVWIANYSLDVSET